MPTLHLDSNDGGSLTMTSDESPEPLYWHVTLQSVGLSAVTDIDLDSIRHTVGPISEFFAALAADWRGWTGERIWGQRPLILTATHDGIGYVTLTIDLEPNRYNDPDWRARGLLTLDAGRLDQAARDAAKLPNLLPNA